MKFIPSEAFEKENVKKIISWFQPFSKKKYVIATIAFFLWIIFFDQNSFIEKIDDLKEINKLEQAKDFYRAKIKSDSIQLKNIKNNKSVEKYAREQYLMKKDNEDVFVIVQDDK